ncbi:MAG: thiolase family protein, partial [Dehalococcoidia bacterium]|nr:thiolase family protein [Dehalococcoidia bacterium]
LNQVGMKRAELGTIITSSSDFWQGISCSNSVYFEAIGAYLKDSSKAAEDGASGFMYGLMRVMSGHFDNALVHAITKSSEIPSLSTLTNLYADPFFQRPVGLDDVSTAAMQARLYMEKYKITEEQAAKVVVKNLGNALSNPYAHKKGKISVDEVLKSEVMAYPIKALDCAAYSDGTCAMLLASEEKAKKLTNNPVWVKGVGWCVDHQFFGDRDLLDGGLRKAARKAYDMAGIKNPMKEIDVAEICEPYSFQELLWYEQLGLCKDGEGGKLIDSGVTAMDGELPVNPSGGVLATNPYVARGLIRIAEAALQIMGEAGERQVPGVKTALAHSTHGFAGQLHSVVILGK